VFGVQQRFGLGAVQDEVRDVVQHAEGAVLERAEEHKEVQGVHIGRGSVHEQGAEQPEAGGGRRAAEGDDGAGAAGQADAAAALEAVRDRGCLN